MVLDELVAISKTKNNVKVDLCSAALPNPKVPYRILARHHAYSCDGISELLVVCRRKLRFSWLPARNTKVKAIKNFSHLV